MGLCLGHMTTPGPVDCRFDQMGSLPTAIGGVVGPSQDHN